MFREMRRKNQQLPPAEAAAILENATAGTLALAGDDGYPYAVPLSFVYTGGTLYFHCAVAGHKLDAIARCDKASFCVIEKDEIRPKEYTTYFRSVIAFGRARLVADEKERLAAIEALAAKYSPLEEEGRRAEIESQFARMAVIALQVEHLTGKEAIELHRMRGGK